MHIVHITVSKELHMFKGDAPANVTSLNLALFSFLAHNNRYVYSTSKRAPDNDDSSSSHRKYVARLQEYFDVCNGDPNAPSDQHFCKDSLCCAQDCVGFNRDVCVRKVVLAKLNLIFVRIPTTPSEGKWTKRRSACSILHLASG